MKESVSVKKLDVLPSKYFTVKIEKRNAYADNQSVKNVARRLPYCLHNGTKTNNTTAF